MNVKKQMKEVFKLYFDDDILSITVKEENYDKYNDFRKYGFIETVSGKEYILKAYKNDYNKPEHVYAYAELSNTFKSSGINVPLFYKCKEHNYFTQYDFDNGRYLIWCEELLPYEVFEDRLNLSNNFYSTIGSFLGAMHTVSKDKNISYPWNSSLVLFDTFSSDDEFDENYENAKSFYTNLSSSDVNKNLLNNIWHTYNSKRDEVKKAYEKLPYGAVQGDLSLCNILSDEKMNPVAIIDFNQSGNDRFVSDMMQWAIYFVFNGTVKELTNELQSNLKDYYKGYTDNYSLNKDELSCINNLYNIIRPFRYYERENPVIEMINEGNFEEANRHLEWILHELTRDDIIEIL